MITEHWVEFSVLYSSSPLASHSIYLSVEATIFFFLCILEQDDLLEGKKASSTTRGFTAKEHSGAKLILPLRPKRIDAN